MKFKKLSIIILFFLSGACKQQEKVPPAIPPVESINFDFSYFKQTNKGNLNYTLAVDRINSWKLYIEDSINIHYNSLSEASYNEFKYQKDQTWLMNYLFNVDNVSYNAAFFAIIEADTVLYKTFLSFDTDTIMFLDGKFYNNTKAGNWTLNIPVTNEEDSTLTEIKFLSVNWSVDSLNNKEIKFTNNKVGTENLNYILYKDSVDAHYNSYLNIYNIGQDNHSIIEWNKTTKAGRIKDPLHYNNEDWHCWDEKYQDIDCN
ncbi:MAG: hypothetical protein L3J35_06200 [Bacteroidales bacterium]|nr:hypothetical protein [Bacteroidales bacterium]